MPYGTPVPQVGYGTPAPTATPAPEVGYGAPQELLPQVKMDEDVFDSDKFEDLEYDMEMDN